MGPFTDEEELHDYLLSPASGHGFNSTADFNKALAQATEIRKYSHKITFTHGDFKAHNILVGDDGHLSAFLDWESAGWYPEYWDFTTASRYGKNSWWAQVALWVGGEQYDEELACDIALNSLTVDSYIAF
ncbi:Aminoglycoside phosphotransferase [Penicillium italicum]|uniref:Aminoglycoside phosphotransferase n=1 Tax=Penicillium italicum TaxID=40296 RepID=A0A0A2L8Y6_PENIT|nr:Aminoglycoside phosphotransferase [Penicillium italicum]